MKKDNFETGQLVRSKFTRDIGRVVGVDRDYHGARSAFKVYGAQRGQAIRPGMETHIGPTKDGIRDRVKKVYKGRLVKHLRRSEWGTGLVLATRTKEKFDREGNGGLFVAQFKVLFSVGGEGWFDRAVLWLLPLASTAPAAPGEPLLDP